MIDTKILQTVLDYFSREGAALSTDGDNAYYRHPTLPGVRCPVGLFIPDELYSTEMEGQRIDRVVKMLPEGFFSPDELDTLVSLQILHDASDDVSDFLRSVKLWSESQDV